MAVRYVNGTHVYLLPSPSEADPEGVSGAVEQLLGAWLDVDLAELDNGWVPATDRQGRSGFVRLDDVREEALLKVFFLDVDQGDSTVVQTPRRILVIDGGPSRGLRDWMLQHYASLIEEDGRLQIETLVVTHFDLDHYQGVTSLLKDEHISIRRLLHNGLPRYKHDAGKFLNLGHEAAVGELTTDLSDLESAIFLRDEGLLATKFGWFVDAAERAHNEGRLGRIGRLFRREPHEPAHRLPGFSDDDCPVEVLGPVTTRSHGAIRLPVFSDPHREGGEGSESHTVNGNSVVLRLRYGDFSFLFGGDLNQPAQRYLLDRYDSGSVFRADVSKACHHGSADFELNFLASVRAQATVFSSGDSGSYDHPMPDALGAASRHTDVQFPLILSTELARETSASKVLLGHINARSNGNLLVMAQRKERPTARKSWHTFPVPYPGPFG